jgi:hypothetical protein
MSEGKGNRERKKKYKAGLNEEDARDEWKPVERKSERRDYIGRETAMSKKKGRYFKGKEASNWDGSLKRNNSESNLCLKGKGSLTMKRKQAWTELNLNGKRT